MSRHRENVDASVQKLRERMSAIDKEVETLSAMQAAVQRRLELLTREYAFLRAKYAYMQHEETDNRTAMTAQKLLDAEGY